LAWQSCPASRIDADSPCLRFPIVHFSSSVCNHGFILDSVLYFSDRLNCVSRSCFCYLHQLHLICQFLPVHSIMTLVHTLIFARIDYGRSVQPFWAKGRSILFLVHLRAEDKIIIRTFKSQVSKTENKIYLTSLFVACGFILLP